MLDDATVTWSFIVASSSLPLKSLNDAADTTARLGSFLQRLRPAFRQITVGSSENLPVAAPRDEKGRALAPTADVPMIARRHITLAGPLRSYSVFRDPPGIFAWSRIDLHVHRGERAAISASALSAELKGVLYEKG